MKGMVPWRKRPVEPVLSRGPEHPFELFHRQMDALFEDFFKEFGLSASPARWVRGFEGGELSPTVDLTETDEAVQVTAELPGLEEKDLEVTVDENLLTIKGEKKQEREEKKRSYYLSERSYGSFMRSLPLPVGVDREKIKAQFKNGVLSITLPKTEQAKTERKRIPIGKAA